MYYDALKTFVTLAEVGNFTKASESLHISQPSVSLHIKNLEKEFQTELFRRSPKGVQITPTGKILYSRARQLMAIYEQAKDEILEHHNSVRGKLIIGASFTIGEYILPGLLLKVQNDFPELEFQIVIGNTDEIVNDVQVFKVDIGLIEGHTNEKELMVHPLMEDELFLVSPKSHPLAGKDEVSIYDLQNHAWVTREEGSGTREYLNHFIRSNGIKVKSLLTISSNQGVKESIMKGLGLSLLSQSVIDREVKHGELSIIHLKNKKFTRTLSYIYSPIMRNKRSVEAFMQVLSKE
ncbi:LysR family transcriptional regulator [Neobacillus piezotolerans]|uniref:LysR family transcriptional regulator n=1 Tax=Neobacillus piezotolerans TaxID=2259171 RepID=A0A3D8GSL6_9BACI|nr:LysR family transcriptional regulator [Neobacillus piezotolerans]RDU37347.1 LysR family transcriptional regulator [Neobacillus piezotolerans]